jgi:hypothetical protein
MFSDEQDRKDAETLVRNWNDTLRHLARQKRWDLDSTFDLARVYRVPGTTNRKVKSDETPVYIIEIEESRRYTAATIASKVIAEALVARVPKEHSSVKIADDLTLDPAASVDSDIIDALCDADPKFKASWERTRKDLPDQSGSSYDLSLATIAAIAGLTDQVIVNLLINSRRRHKDNLKLRHDYYRRTLFKARQGLVREAAMQTLDEMLHADPEDFEEPLVPEQEDEPAPSPFTDEDSGSPNPEPPAPKASRPAAPTKEEKSRQAILHHVSDLLGIQIENIVKYVSSEPTYRLQTAHGGIMLGDVGGLVKQDALRLKIAALTSFYMPTFKAKQWETIAQSLLRACEEQSAGEEATDEGEIRIWLRIYLSENLPATSGITHDVVIQMTPYIETESKNIYIFGVGLQDWLKKKYGQNITSKRLGFLLRLHGAAPEIVGCSVNGRKTTRAVWKLPYQDQESEF